MMMLELTSGSGPQTACSHAGESTGRGRASCPQVDQISSFVLGLLEEEEMNEMIDHVRVCDRCRNFVNVVSEVIETL